jgi:hypothetical protein
VKSKYEVPAKRLEELIQEGKQVAALERDSSVGPYIQDQVPLNAWLVKVENIIEAVFGRESPHQRALAKSMEGHPEHAYEVLRIVGVLTGALDDLKGGFLDRQEQLVAAEVFDSVIDQAKHLAVKGFKDPAAVLARVVIEDALRRLCRAEGLDSNGKAASLNEALRNSGRFLKPQWRAIQAWLDIGNSAAHGSFDDYTEADVKNMIDDIERFLAREVGG